MWKLSQNCLVKRLIFSLTKAIPFTTRKVPNITVGFGPMFCFVRLKISWRNGTQTKLFEKDTRKECWGRSRVESCAEMDG